MTTTDRETLREGATRRGFDPRVASAGESPESMPSVANSAGSIAFAAPFLTHRPASAAARSAPATAPAPAPGETAHDALAAYERRLDDVERRFETLRAKMELTLPSGITKCARSGIRAAFASARLRAEKARAVASRDAEPRRRRLGSKEGQRVLRSWILAHFDHPFPTREEKRRLAREIGSSEFAIGNFFINARARFHKPLVMALADELEREGVDVLNARDEERVR